MFAKANIWITTKVHTIGQGFRLTTTASGVVRQQGAGGNCATVGQKGGGIWGGSEKAEKEEMRWLEEGIKM